MSEEKINLQYQLSNKLVRVLEKFLKANSTEFDGKDIFTAWFIATSFIMERVVAEEDKIPEAYDLMVKLLKQRKEKFIP